MGFFLQRLLLHPSRPLAALGLLLATAGAARAQAPVAASQAVTVQLSPSGVATLQATSVNNGSTGSGNTYTIQKIRYGQVNENGTLTLTAPSGFTFTNSAPFASYGTPGGSNGNYTVGSCNSPNSASVVNNSLSGQNAGSIVASNSAFSTDPCYGTPKSLAVVAAYSTNAASQTYSSAELGNNNYVLLTATNASGSSTRTAQVTVVPQTNNALAFDGSDDYVALPSSTPVPVGNSNYTIEAWIKPTSMGVYGIVGWGNYGANNQVNALRLDPANGGSLRNYWWANDLSVTVGNLADGKWHHVAATFDGTTRAIYVDGVFKGSDTPSGHNVPNAANMRLGVTCANCPQVNGFAVEYFPGSLDEVRIYNVGLTQAQVQADMYSTTSALPASQQYYANFDQGTAGGTNAGLTSLTDQSGNGSTGTLTNFALTGTSSNWVRSFPTITGISPTSGKSGTSVTVTGTNLTDATSFAFNGLTSASFTTPASDLTATLTAPVCVTTGPVSVVSATLTRYNGSVFTLVNDLVVNTTQSIPADSYSSLTVNSPGVGTLAGNVTVSGSTAINSGGTLSDGCSVLSGAGSFTLAAGGTLGICAAQGISSSGATGAIQNTGTRSFASDASYVYNGTAAQSTGSGLPAQVRNLSTTNASPVTLSQAASVAQVLTVGGSGNLATGGNALTLLSSSAGTALVVNSGSGTVSGAGFTMQRYIDPSLNAGAGYRHYSAPVSNTTLADLATTGYAPEISQAATYNSSATPGTTTPFPTLFAYDQSRLATVTSNYSAFDKGFVVPTALSAPMSVGRGYVAQVGAAALVDFVGTPTTGDQTPLSLTRGTDAAAGWQLVGNPYPSPLDWSLVALADRQNLDGAMYVVQSSGPYAGGYRTYTNGQSTSATNNPLIASSQGFWVRVSAGQTSGSLTFRQAQRVTSYASQPAFQRTTADPRPALRLELAGAGLADGWVTYAEAGATAAFDPQYDAAKLPNSTGLNLSSASATDNLAIDGQAAFTTATVLPLAMGVPAAGTYTLTASALSNLPAGLTAYLHDGATGQTLALAVGSAYSFSVTAAQAQALLVGRFTLQFSATAAPLAATPAALAAQVLAYPNPAHGSFTVALPGVPGAAVVQAELLNALGQVVRRQQAALPASGTTLTVPTDGLAAGVYVLRLAAGTTTVIKRVVLD